MIISNIVENSNTVDPEVSKVESVYGHEKERNDKEVR